MWNKDFIVFGIENENTSKRHQNILINNIREMIGVCVDVDLGELVCNTRKSRSNFENTGELFNKEKLFIISLKHKGHDSLADLEKLISDLCRLNDQHSYFRYNSDTKTFLLCNVSNRPEDQKYMGGQAILMPKKVSKEMAEDFQQFFFHPTTKSYWI